MTKSACDIEIYSNYTLLYVYVKLLFIITIFNLGFLVFGTTGEYVSLSENEKISLVKNVRDSVQPDKLVIVGSGCECKIHLVTYIIFHEHNLFFPPLTRKLLIIFHSKKSFNPFN